MPPLDLKLRQERVLLLAPTIRDGELTHSLLQRAGLTCLLCKDLRQLSIEARVGAGALLLTEDVLFNQQISELIAVLEAQETWSDLPVIMLMRGGAQSPAATRVLQALRNVTLLERPAQSRTVVSATMTAIRSRQRQYLVREQIIEINRARARYEKLQQQLEVAVAASELGTFHCEIPLNEVIWNDQCKAHFWLEPDADVDIDRFYSILHPDDRQRTREAIEACVNRGEMYDVEYRTVSPDGQIRWVRATGRTYFDEKGQPRQFDGTTQDVTARKNAEEHLRRTSEERKLLLESERAARTEAERAGRMKDEFLATLSHELRTPLNAILGWSQLIRQGQDPETLDEGLAVIERNARVQVQLIEDLLDMSRIISGKLRLNVKSIHPEDFIEAAIETVKPSAEAREIRLTKVLDPDAGPIIGDPARLQQVVWNLLSNAIKFTPRGGMIQVVLARVNSHVQISVTDTGQGIKPEFLPYVFERFRQADASTTRKFGGLGLGLSIVKHLVELHGGTIAATSLGQGRGSTFILRLPVSATFHESPTDDETNDPSPPIVPKSDHPTASLQGLRVLVVDDEPDSRQLVRLVLEESGALVDTAASADEALPLVGSGKPDVLVSDIGMPGTDGYELLRRVRALDSNNGKQIPAIALTAFARSEDRTKALLAGFLVHVSKPVEPRELIATIATIAGRTGKSFHPVDA